MDEFSDIDTGFEQDQPSAYGGFAQWQDTPVWEFPLGLIATAIVSLGVNSMIDVYFALACQVVFMLCGHSGPDAIYNALAGLQAGRGKYTYVILPTLLTTYEAIENFKKNKNNLTYKGSMTLGFYGLGFLATKYRFL